MNTTSNLSATKTKRLLTIIAAVFVMIAANGTESYGQEKRPVQYKQEEYGHTLNLGVGIGYYGYIGYTVPFFFANYEINVARNFTLAPFVGLGSYRSNDYYDYGGRHYYYHETVVPMGVKGTYYFDQILGAGPKWDFYLAASLGFVYDRIVWDDGYYGPKGVARSASPLYLDGHIGTEYHAGRNVGIFLDLSTGVSTLGLAIHHL